MDERVSKVDSSSSEVDERVSKVDSSSSEVDERVSKVDERSSEVDSSSSTTPPLPRSPAPLLPCSPAPCSLLPAPCSLLPTPHSYNPTRGIGRGRGGLYAVNRQVSEINWRALTKFSTPPSLKYCHTWLTTPKGTVDREIKSGSKASSPGITIRVLPLRCTISCTTSKP